MVKVQRMKDGILEHWEGKKKNGKSKTCIFFLLLSFLNYISLLNKNCDTLLYGSKCVEKKYLGQL